MSLSFSPYSNDTDTEGMEMINPLRVNHQHNSTLKYFLRLAKIVVLDIIITRREVHLLQAEEICFNHTQILKL